MKSKTQVFIILALMLFLTSCSAITYNLDSYHQTFVGSHIRNEEALGKVNKVALVAFTVQSPSIGDVELFSPLGDLAYQQALTEMQAQSTLTFVPMEQIVANESYQAMRITLDSQTYSPLDGLTDLPEGLSDQDIADLCDSLGADALMFIRLEFDWKFPTINAVTMKTRAHSFLMVPSGSEVVWESKLLTWEETLVPVPASFKLILGMPNADEWAEIVDSASEVVKVRALGGEPIFLLAAETANTR